MQVWFSGVHSDIGGGYPADRNALSKVTLEWMLVEASKHGLQLEMSNAKAAVNFDLPLDYSQFTVNKSLTKSWWLLEAFPKRVYNFKKKRRIWHCNWGRRRPMAEYSAIHASVLERVETEHNYVPMNIPTDTSTEPWERL